MFLVQHLQPRGALAQAPHPPTFPNHQQELRTTSNWSTVMNPFYSRAWGPAIPLDRL